MGQVPMGDAIFYAILFVIFLALGNWVLNTRDDKDADITHMSSSDYVKVSCSYALATLALLFLCFAIAAFVVADKQSLVDMMNHFEVVK